MNDIHAVVNNPVTPSDDFDSYLKKRLGEGWKITSDGDSAVQIRAPRSLSKRGGIAIAAGLLLLPVFGIGLLVLVGVAVEAWMKGLKTELLMRPK